MIFFMQYNTKGSAYHADYQHGWDLIVYLIIDLAPPAERVPQLGWDRTVAKQHKHFPAH
jgi:imidazoleglycerol phosphate synthase glutamine amidotransferase subunit HisH